MTGPLLADLEQWAAPDRKACRPRRRNRRAAGTRAGTERILSGMAAVQAGDYVVATKGFGGIIREPVPAGARGRVVDAPWLGPIRVLFDKHDWLNGHRQVLVDVQADEIAVIR